MFRVGLALLQVNQVELMQLDMEGMSQVGQGPRKGGIAPSPRRGTWAGKVRCSEFLSSLILFYPLWPLRLPGELGWALRSPRLCQTQSRASSLGREEGPGPGSGKFHPSFLLSPKPLW